jgi:hypothetical protein
MTRNAVGSSTGERLNTDELQLVMILTAAPSGRNILDGGNHGT